MKRLFFTMVLLSFFFVSKSQVHLGITTGANSTFVLDKGLSEDPRYNSTATYNFSPIGASFGIDLGKKFGIQLESLLTNQGQIFEVIDATKKIVGERNIDLTYLQLPLFFKFMSGKDTRARANFALGPQFSFLTKGTETLQYAGSIMEVADEFAVENPDGTYTIKDPSTGETLDAMAIASTTEAGTYNVNELPTTELLSNTAKSELNKFRNTELQIAAAFGLDIDLSKNLYLSSVIRANYSLTDMRNGDIVDQLKEGSLSDLFEKRANLLVGVQLGINYVFGGTRFFK